MELDQRAEKNNHIIWHKNKKTQFTAVQQVFKVWFSRVIWPHREFSDIDINYFCSSLSSLAEAVPLWCADVGQQSSTCTDTLSLPLLRGEIRRRERRPMWKFNKWSKSCMHQQRLRNLFTTSHGQANVQTLPGKQGVTMHNDNLERQMP